MKEVVLVTGGAGFIGRHVVQALIERGRKVRVLDALIPQVHGADGRSADLHPDAELIHADIRDESAVRAAVAGADSVIHLAAEVGVGQSMYAVDRYVEANDHGTAVLMQALIDRPVRRVVVASSMSIYGEGLYHDVEGTPLETVERAPPAPGVDWDPVDRRGRPLVPVPTPEWKRPNLASVYALTKYVQERLVLTLAPAYGMEGVALRLFNVYGPGQALSNPYTGVLAIFASRIANGARPLVFEDGRQRRDFVHVRDVARAFLLALDHPAASGGVFNIASGRDRSIVEIGREIAAAMGREDVEPEILHKTRIGDIRHCFADTGLARERLAFDADTDFRDGLAELADWVARQEAEDRVAEARRELEARGLVA